MIITIPDLLISIGSLICLTSIWAQAYQNYKQKSAIETSWYFIVFYLIAIMMFVIGKSMAQLYYTAAVDLLSSGAFIAIIYQKISPAYKPSE